MNNQKKIILAVGASGTLLVGSLYYVFANRDQSQEVLVKEETVLKEVLQSSPSQSTKEKEDDHTDYTQQVVLKIREDGYVTAHGDHEHFIKGPVPFDAIYLKSLVVDDPNYVLNKADIVSEIKDGYVIKYDGKYRIYLKDGDLAKNVRSQEELLEIRRNVRTRASGDHAHAEMASGHDNYQFRPQDIVSETEDGYIVKHGDHFHYIEKSKVQGNNTQLAAGNPTVRPNGPVAAAHEEDHFVFDRKNIVSETEIGYVVKHGDHTHFVFKKDVDAAPAKPVSNVETSPIVEVPKVEAPLPEKPQVPDTKPVDPPKEDLRKIHEAKIDYLAKLHKVNPAEIQVSGDQLFYPHGDHFHSVKIADIQVVTAPVAEVAPEKETPKVEFSKEILDKIAYVASLHMVPAESIVVNLEAGYLDYPHGDHSHRLLLADIQLPSEVATNPETPTIDTNVDLEEEFEKELKALAAAFHVEPGNILVENGMMKVPHGDHTHDYPIKSKGWQAYLANKIDPIHDVFVAGGLNRQVVSKRLDELKALAAKRFEDNPRQLGRINRVLDDYRDHNVAWGSNSTEGFLAALATFEKEKILVGTKETVASPAQPLVDNVTITKGSLMDKLDLLKEVAKESKDDYFNYLSEINNLKESVGYSHTSELVGLKERIEQLEAKIRQSLVKTSEEITYEAQLSTVRDLIKQLDESTYMIKKIQFLNQLDDLETKTNAKDLSALETEVRSLVSPSEATSPTTTPENGAGDQASSQAQPLAQRLEALHQTIKSIDESAHFMKKYTFMNAYQTVDEAAADPAKQEELLLQLKNQVDEFLASLNPAAPVVEEPVVEKETMAVLNERIYQKIRTIDEDNHLLKRMAFLQDYYGLSEDEAKRETAIALEAQVDAFLASVTKQPEANTETTPVAPATNPQDQANYDQLVYFIEANQGDSRLTTEQQADITRLFNQAVALKENQDIKTANNTLQTAKNIIMTTFKADKE